MQKKKKIKNYQKKIAAFQLAKNNYKQTQDNNINFDNTNIYFTSIFEIISRLFIIISQFIFGIGIFINGFLFVMFVVDKIANFGVVEFSQIIARILFFLFSVIPVLVILFFLLPISICNVVSTLKTWMIIFLTYGLVIYMVAIALAIWNLIWFNTHWNNFNFSKIILYVPLICFLLSFLFIVCFSSCLLIILNRLINKLENIYIENYFVRMKIN